MNNKGKKNVWHLSLTSLFTDLSSEMIFPILPLFMANVLGINKAMIGLIEGLAESVSSIVHVISGYVSDKLRRRKQLIVFGYSLSGISKLLFAVASTWQHVLLFRVSDRFGKGTRDAPRDSLITLSVDKKYHGKYFGFQKALDRLGSVIGAIILILLLNFVTQNYRLIFSLSIIPSIIAVSILVLFVKDVRGKVKKKYEFEFKKMPKKYKIFLMASIIFTLANFSYAFFILKMQDIGVSIFMIPAAYLVYSTIYSVFSIPAGRLSDKIGRKKVISMGYVIFFLTVSAFAFTTEPTFAWILMAFYGLHWALTESVSRAFVSDLAPEGEEGTAFGLYYTSIGLAALPSSLIAGILWESLSPFATFGFSALLSFIALMILQTIKK